MNNTKYEQGLRLLGQPVLPLVSMVQFFLLTGPYDTAEAVLAELPEPIETEHAVYQKPKDLLEQYLPLLKLFEQVKKSTLSTFPTVNVQGEAVDEITAGTTWILQKILTAELEKINSLLCAPCKCTLCCVGPEKEMEQEFFEIPLTPYETRQFGINTFDNEESRQHNPMDEMPYFTGDIPFYLQAEPALIHWKKGWSLILPKYSNCPNLVPENGRCNVYIDRPDVCRRPQIFPYIIEPLELNERGEQIFRIRHSLLAITDCPYVEELKEEISTYAAASELELIFSQNKQ